MLSMLTTPRSKAERKQAIAKAESMYARGALQDQRQAPRDDERGLVRATPEPLR